MFTQPMRPRNLPKRLPDIRDFIAQPKYDGWYVVFRDGRAYTRTGEDITSWACWQGRDLPENAVGELLHVYGRAKIPSLSNSRDGMRVVLFDIPGPAPLEVRLYELGLVASVYGFGHAPSLEFSSWEDANDQLAVIQRNPLIEGFVLKRRASAWTSGEQHKDWYRMKERV